MDRYLVISFDQIQFREDGGAMETGCKVLKIRKRITVRSSSQVEAAVVAAGPPGTVRLGDKMKRRGTWTSRSADNTRCL